MLLHERWLNRLGRQLSLLGPLDGPRARAELEWGLVLVVKAALSGQGQPGLGEWVRQQVGPAGWPLSPEADATTEARPLARRLGEQLRARMNPRVESVRAGETVVGP